MKHLLIVPILSHTLVTIISLVALATTVTGGNLPFDTLPNNNCQMPTVCGQVKDTTVQCRCDDTITVCRNQAHQYCWGSNTLHQTSGCPSMPSSCSSSFNSTASCLCNSTNVLCIDQYSHVCYGAIQGTSVSLLPLGGLPPASASTLASSSSSSASASVTPLSSSRVQSSSNPSQPSGSMAATSTPIPNSSSRLSSSLPFVIIPLLFISHHFYF